MKYKFEIKKENRSIIWKILFLLIYFSFYAISIRLFMTYFPFINKGLIIIVGILIYLIIIYFNNPTIGFNRNLGVFHFEKGYTRN